MVKNDSFAHRTVRPPFFPFLYSSCFPFPLHAAASITSHSQRVLYPLALNHLTLSTWHSFWFRSKFF